jgi:hypothetical protein
MTYASQLGSEVLVIGWLVSNGCIWDHLTHFASCFPIESTQVLALLHLEEVCTFLLGSSARFVAIKGNLHLVWHILQYETGGCQRDKHKLRSSLVLCTYYQRFTADSLAHNNIKHVTISSRTVMSATMWC